MAEKAFRLVQEQLAQVYFLRAHLLWIMILQENGKATLSVAASFVERLPDEGDHQRQGRKDCKRRPVELTL